MFCHVQATPNHEKANDIGCRFDTVCYWLMSHSFHLLFTPDSQTHVDPSARSRLKAALIRARCVNA